MTIFIHKGEKCVYFSFNLEEVFLKQLLINMKKILIWTFLLNIIITYRRGNWNSQLKRINYFRLEVRPVPFLALVSAFLVEDFLALLAGAGRFLATGSPLLVGGPRFFLGVYSGSSSSSSEGTLNLDFFFAGVLAGFLAGFFADFLYMSQTWPL